MTPTRRGFLGAITAALAAPVVVPHLTASKPAPKTPTVQWFASGNVHPGDFIFSSTSAVGVALHSARPGEHVDIAVYGGTDANL